RVGVLRHKLGELQLGLAAGEQAVELNRQLVADFPDVPAYRLELARCHALIGVLQNAHRDGGAAAVAAHQSAIALLERLGAELPKEALYRRDLAASYVALANALSKLRKYGEVVAELKKALVLQEQLVADSPLVPHYRQHEARTHNALGLASVGLNR